MSEEKMMRLGQVARKLNIGLPTIREYLSEKGHDVDSNPNAKINGEQYALLAREFADSAHDKEEASGLTIGTKHADNQVIKATSSHTVKKEDDEEILIKGYGQGQEQEVESPKEAAPAKSEPEQEVTKVESPKLQGFKVVGKIDLDKKKQAPKDEPAPEVKEEAPAEVAPEPAKEEAAPVAKEEAPVEEAKAETKEETAPAQEAAAPEKAQPTEEAAPTQEVAATEEAVPSQEEEKPKSSVIEAKADSLKGLTVLGKIELPKEKSKKAKPVASSDDQKDKKKRPRKRIRVENERRPAGGGGAGGKRTESRPQKEEPSDKQIQDQIKATLAKLSGSKSTTGNRSKYRKEKRSTRAEANEEKILQEQEESKVLKMTEFISANDLASLMGVSVNDVIASCMSLGMFVSINQRLDAESITIIADEFGFDVEFTSADDEVEISEQVDAPEDLHHRAPIVTIMGHVDHGKTSLLDYIRSAKVTEGEAGGITQHIGAYDVTTNDGKRVAFLDTPGHEAFTAMRARGAKITDVVIIVVAADDSVMPQTKEAINHAMVAEVPIVIAINKIDKPNANPDKIKEDLANNNILVEDWGGKYQCQEISAKTGQGIDELLEKVILESELLDLKANPDKPAIGNVIEAELDKGRGYVTTIMVQTGTLRIGDVLLAGSHFGKVKALFDHRGRRMQEAGPSTPVLMLGLDGAPQAGDKFNVMASDREAREIATKREQILREQSMRTKKHITLDEIGRRLAIGSFKELNVIIKGDVDGSIEALSDSLLKLSTGEVQVNIIHKAVGQISESDVLLASASDAIILGFQVRPSPAARKIAENEEIEIRLYSIIYDAINEIKDAMEGMLAPSVEEVITGNIEVREVFKITKVGTVAGCYVTDGFVKRQNQIRLIRDGIVAYTGEINQLKRFKDDVNEVKGGYECGISIKSYNDIQEGDVIEGFEEREVKRTL
ncbi:MAG: translation initiation factor IF-2 [Cyclobacteriaceae bacterium]